MGFRYSNEVDKLKQRQLMPLDEYQKEQSMFDQPNPYETGISSGAVMSDENLMQQTTAPTVDFSKKTLQEQMPQKSESAVVLDSAADGMTMSGNPKLMAAGLALKTIQGVAQAKAENRRAKYNAELQKMKARQDAISQMAQIGRGLKA
jgi:hypothetical protein